MLGFTALSNLTLVSAEEEYSEYSNEVAPIKWSEFEKIAQGDEEFELLEDTLNNSTNYILNTWYDENGYHETDNYIDFGGTGEWEIRGPGMAALGTAVPLATGHYDSEETGLSEEEAIDRVTHLVTSLAYRHVTNSSDGWGGIDRGVQNDWQTPLWSYYTGFAGWLLWDYLEPEDQQNIQEMVEWEANNIPEPRYYQDEEGNMVNEGNTQAEENSSWASLLGLASSMMPNHQNKNDWTNQMIDLAIAAFSRPSDLASDKVLNGRKIEDVIEGTNIMDNGVVVNHDILHPIYMLTIEQNMNPPLTLSLAQEKTPEAVLHNTDLVYQALTDIEFDAEEYGEPGGTIYQEEGIYYPEGNDWGARFPFYFGQVDVLANIFGLDHMSSSDASTWSRIHNTEALEMQERFEDGRTYAGDEESNYELREERISQIAGSTFLAKWIEEQDLYRITDYSYGGSVEEGERLPDTDSNVYTSIIIGLGVLLLGSGLYIYNKKAKNS